MDNMPAYRLVSAQEGIMCKYKHADDDFMGFSPYTPYKSVPYFVIWGEGLPPN